MEKQTKKKQEKKYIARYYEYDDNGNIFKSYNCHYWICHDNEKNILDIQLSDRGKTIHCHVDIPLEDVLQKIREYIKWKDKIIKRENKDEI